MVRVGRSEDNDLVLRHPSVEPYHCLLVFRGEKVLCFPPDARILRGDRSGESGLDPSMERGSDQDWRTRLTLAHSTRTVAIPEVQRQERAPETGIGDLGRDGTSQRRYFCAHCRVFVPDTEVKRLGLVGHAKRYLCPKCSGLLDLEPEPPKPASDRKKWFRRAARDRASTSPAKH